MSTTGAVFPGNGSSVSSNPWDDITWTNPGNIVSDNTSYAQITAPTFDTDVRSYLLRAYNFDFSAIPDGATIDGIIVTINACYVNNSGSIAHVRLVDASAALVGDNRADTPVALNLNTLTNHVFGSSSDKWNATPTAAMIKDADFGVEVGCIATANDCDIYIDFVTIEVYYTAGGASYSGSASMGGGGAAAATGRKGASGAATVGVLGAIVALGVAAIVGLASITGGGSITAAGRKGASSIAAAAGGGSVTASGLKGGRGAPLVTGSGSIAGLGSKAGSGAALATGASGAASSGTKAASGSSAVSGAGAVMASGTSEEIEHYSGAAVGTGGGSIVALGSKGGRGAGTVSGGAGMFSETGSKAASGASGPAGAGGLESIGAKAASGTAAAAGAGSIEAAGSVLPTQSGAAVLSGGGEIVAYGVKGIWQTFCASPAATSRTAEVDSGLKSKYVKPASRMVTINRRRTWK